MDKHCLLTRLLWLCYTIITIISIIIIFTAGWCMSRILILLSAGAEILLKELTAGTNSHNQKCSRSSRLIYQLYIYACIIIVSYLYNYYSYSYRHIVTCKYQYIYSYRNTNLDFLSIWRVTIQKYPVKLPADTNSLNCSPKSDLG